MKENSGKRVDTDRNNKGRTIQERIIKKRKEEAFKKIIIKKRKEVGENKEILNKKRQKSK
jgi:hypothetical protein